MKASRVIRADISFANLVDMKIDKERKAGNKNFSQVDATKFFFGKITAGGFLTKLDWL